MTLVPTLLFAILEGSLWLGGYGWPTDYFLDGTTTENPEVWIDNGDFDRWFFPPGLQGSSRPTPFAIVKKKPTDTYRVFVLGESAAMGFPDPSTSFARILEVMLAEHYPGKRIEVVNTAMVAINSHVVLPIARQCAEREPDLFVVHLGNNEVIGPFGAAGVLGPFSPRLGVIRANLAVKSTRSGQLLNRTIQGLGQRRQAPRAWNGMATFARSEMRSDDSRLERIQAHFRENLQDICAAGTDGGIPVIVCTIPVNLKDSAPFGSLHAPDLSKEQTAAWENAFKDGVALETEKKFAPAIRCYETAGAIDDTFADLAFRMGRCFVGLGQTARAREQFERALELDTLRFRSDKTINATIRAVAAARENTGVRLVDAERSFARNSPDSIPGEELFLEHVHMNFKGNYLLARTVFETITELAPPGLGAPARQRLEALSEKSCAEKLAYTEWNDFRSTKQIFEMLTIMTPFTGQLDHRDRARRWKARLEAMHVGLRSGGMQKALAVYQQALRPADRDWLMRMNYAELLTECGSLQRAEEQYIEALVLMRHAFSGHCKLGNLQLKMGRVDEAVAHFREAIRLAPNTLDGYFGLAEAAAAEGKKDEAREIYEERVRNGNNRLSALMWLAAYLSRIGKPAEAEERFKEALQLAPNNVTALVELGNVAFAQDHVEEAIEHYESVLRIWPDWPGLIDQLAKARMKLAKGKGTRKETAPGK